MKSKRPVPKMEPLFIDFLNSIINEDFILAFLKRLELLFNDKEDKKCVQEFREVFKSHHLEGYRLTQTKFKDQMDYIINYGKFDHDFPGWANFYLASLRELKKEDAFGNEERFVQIGDPNGDWITGLILYNFSLFCKYYGTELLKKCPTCNKYFTTKGKYAKFCSKSCKK